MLELKESTAKHPAVDLKDILSVLLDSSKIVVPSSTVKAIAIKLLTDQTDSYIRKGEVEYQHK